MLKKQLYMEHKQSEIVPEYNGSLSCDRHLNCYLVLYVVCSWTLEGMNQFIMWIALALVLMF